MNFKPKIFLAYDSEDKEIVYSFQKKFIDSKCIAFIDIDLEKGENAMQVIYKKIDKTNYFIPFFSNKSVQNRKHFSWECDYATKSKKSKRKFILPIWINDCIIPDEFTSLRYNFNKYTKTNTTDEDFNKLIVDIKKDYRWKLLRKSILCSLSLAVVVIICILLVSKYESESPINRQQTVTNTPIDSLTKTTSSNDSIISKDTVANILDGTSGKTGKTSKLESGIKTLQTNDNNKQPKDNIEVSKSDSIQNKVLDGTVVEKDTNGMDKLDKEEKIYDSGKEKSKDKLDEEEKIYK